MKKNNKGFTLVELLAVIVILGLLMAIAIPSVTKYITQSRVKTLVSSMDSYVTAIVTQVNAGEYKFSDSTKVFAVPIECISLEKGGTNPFGNWHQANDAYWAYVLVHYDNENYNYEYGFTFKDDAGYGLYPTKFDLITNDLVRTGYEDLSKPFSGVISNFVEPSEWSGFSNINKSTQLIVLEAESDGVSGNGRSTCTLNQKGDNYEQVEQEKANLATSDPIYFGKPYEVVNDEGILISIIFNRDGSAKYYEDCVLTDSTESGFYRYEDGKLIWTDDGSDAGVIVNDKRTIIDGEYYAYVNFSPNWCK